jgi:hypothetical protein
MLPVLLKRTFQLRNNLPQRTPSRHINILSHRKYLMEQTDVFPDIIVNSKLEELKTLTDCATKILITSDSDLKVTIYMFNLSRNFQGTVYSIRG